MGISLLSGVFKSTDKIQVVDAILLALRVVVIVFVILALIMLFIGGLAAYTFVWDLGDVGVGLMTVFNMIALFPMARHALDSLKDYEERRKSNQKV